MLRILHFLLKITGNYGRVVSEGLARYSCFRRSIIEGWVKTMKQITGL
jgi:hypothetical protein